MLGAMPPASSGRTPRRAETRRRLLAATFDVVTREGFHAATVAGIATQAGYSIGALYSNFSSKDELLFAAFDEHLQWFERELQKATQATDTTGAIADWLSALSSPPDQFFIFIEFWSYAVRRPKLRTQLAQRMTEMRVQVEALTTQRRAGQPGLPPGLTALLLLAIGRGLALEKLVDPDAIPDQEVATLLSALLNGLGPRGLKGRR
jgi:AcrR family transcriptional regulator